MPDQHSLAKDSASPSLSRSHDSTGAEAIRQPSSDRFLLITDSTSVCSSTTPSQLPTPLSPPEDLPIVAPPPPPSSRLKRQREMESELQHEPERRIQPDSQIKEPSKPAEQRNGDSVRRTRASRVIVCDNCRASKIKCSRNSPCGQCSMRRIVCTWNNGGGPPSDSSMFSEANGADQLFKSLKQIDINRAEIARLSREARILAQVLRLSPEEYESLGITTDGQLRQAQPRQVHVSKKRIEVRTSVAFNNSANQPGFVYQPRETADIAPRSESHLSRMSNLGEREPPIPSSLNETSTSSFPSNQ